MDNKILKFKKKLKQVKTQNTLQFFNIKEDTSFIVLEFKNNIAKLTAKEAATLGLTLIIAAKNIFNKGK